MLVPVLCMLVSFVPSILLFFYLRNLRKDDEKYRSSCKRLFWRGILCSFLVALLALVVNLLWAVTVPKTVPAIVRDAFHAFILAALIEEFVKMRTAGKTIRKNADTLTWMDCIAFTAIVGIGFQTIESVVYMVDSNAIQILVRGFTLGHPAYGMLMGYLTGKAMYRRKKSFRFLAFFLPFVIHGLYDFSLSDEFQALNDNLVFVPVIIVIVELFILFRMLFLIRKERRGTIFMTPLRAEQETAEEKDFREQEDEIPAGGIGDPDDRR